jgi:hypothetical protein
MEGFRAAFPDLNFWGAADLIAEGDYVVGRWEGGGTHTGTAFSDFLIGSLPAASGRKMRFTGTTVLRVENGKIAEPACSHPSASSISQVANASALVPAGGVQVDCNDSGGKNSGTEVGLRSLQRARNAGWLTVKVLIKSAWGSDESTKAAFAFLHANAFAAAGHEVQIFLLGEAVNLMRNETMNAVTPVGWPPLSQIMQETIGHKIALNI